MVSGYMNRTLNISCMDFEQPKIGELYCHSTIDRLNICWPTTKANSQAVVSCPPLPGFDTSASATKFCEENGTWYRNKAGNEWANYDQCIAHKPQIVYVFFAGYSLSVLCLSISLFIFFFFKQLRCDRITLHKNLFMCHLINAVFWIAFYISVSNGNTSLRNPVHCQLLFVVATYFSMGTYFWMFSEGLYLAVILRGTFNHSSMLLIVCTITGWGFPFILTLIYALCRYFYEKPENCWITASKMHLILAIPNIIAVLANVIILTFIMRMLITKLRHPSNREEAQLRKTAKAVFILIPLLGFQNVFFLSYSSNKTVSVIQDYVTAIYSSFQGVIVSLILCFFNQEVRIVFRRRTCQHHSLQSRKSSRRGTYVSEINSSSQPQQRRSLGMRAFSVRSSITAD